MHVQTEILQVESVSKRFPGVIALDNVSLNLRAGEVLSVIGENGAGKSTLMKILAGIQSADSGRILIDGQPCTLDSVAAATKAGIALIHQELNLCQNLSVAANIFLGREPTRCGFINQAALFNAAQSILDRVGLDIPPAAIVETLTIGQQQMVEIAKAISKQARILIMDEPTSSLSKKESEALFKIVATLKEQGVAIIYISHRLGEVQTLSDRVTVLRDGQNVGQLTGDDINHPTMVERMVGRQLTSFYKRSQPKIGETVFEVRDLRTVEFPNCQVDFSIKAGEIVGLAGLVGAGRTEILTALFGVTPALSGTLVVEGKSQQITGPRQAMRLGIGLVPEDRKLQGIVLQMSVRENTSLPTLSTLSRLGFVNAKQDAQLAIQMKDRLQTRTPSIEQQVKYLSGGNQQKVVIAKWLALQPKILLMDEPTRGVDVGAKQEIYSLMNELAELTTTPRQKRGVMRSQGTNFVPSKV